MYLLWEAYDFKCKLIFGWIRAGIDQERAKMKINSDSLQLHNKPHFKYTYSQESNSHTVNCLPISKQKHANMFVTDYSKCMLHLFALSYSLWLELKQNSTFPRTVIVGMISATHNSQKTSKCLTMRFKDSASWVPSYIQLFKPCLLTTTTKTIETCLIFRSDILQQDLSSPY